LGQLEVPKTQEQLERLIIDRIQEHHNLEYKSAGALGRDYRQKFDITKDVSSFANADGGVLIYGVAEFQDEQRKHLPEKITPIDTTEFSKEWLQQIIGQIQPALEATIYPVPLNSVDNQTAYVVEVKKGATAHQALDGKYYQRRNFVAEFMLDYQIRDVMGRLERPVISASAYIMLGDHDTKLSLHFEVANAGPVRVKEFLAVIYVPLKFRGTCIVPKEPSVLDETADGYAYRISFNNSRTNSLFPESSMYENFKFEFGQMRQPEPKLLTVIKYTLYADDMPRIKGSFDPEEIF
jgi:hypothetical protein